MKALEKVFGLVLVMIMAMQINNAYAERRVIDNIDYINQVEDMDQANFLGHNSCGPTSAVMMARFHKVQPVPTTCYEGTLEKIQGWYVYNPYVDFTDKSEEDYSDIKLTKDMNASQQHIHEIRDGAHGYIIIEDDGNWLTDPDRLKIYLQNHGLIVSDWIWANRFEAIKQNIDAGLPLIGHSKVSGNGHYLVIVGYDTGESGNEQNVVVHDPYGDAHDTYWNGTESGAGITYPLDGSVPYTKPDGNAGTRSVVVDWVYEVHPVGIYNKFPGYRNRATLSLQPEDEIPQPSQPFVDCYNNNGGQDVFGVPWDNGLGVFVHNWPSGEITDDTIFLQDFIRSDGKWHQLMLNQKLNKAFPAHGQILFFTHNNSGYLLYGELTGKEYYATHMTNGHKLVVQDFEKNNIAHYIGYDTITGITKEYGLSDFFAWHDGGFYPYQIINEGSFHGESFSINGEAYLAIASSTHSFSRIYKWNGSSFTEFQVIGVGGIFGWENFSINGETYLVAGDFYSIYSWMHKWNGSSFERFQRFLLGSDVDWENFVINGETYLAVAGGSRIYKWNGSLFEEFQAISTRGVWDWESFVINGETYLAMANHHDYITYNIDSTIHKWNGSLFEEFQLIPTNGAHDWENFSINGETYLVVANYRDGDNYDIDSKIYKWNGSLFTEFQSISTSGAYDWNGFSINGETYLAVANHYDGATYNVNSKIYKWNGTLFAEFQSIPTNGAYDWESFSINDKTYLAVSNQHTNFVIYTISNESAHQEQMIIQQGETINKVAIIPENCEQSEFSRIIQGSDVEMSLVTPDSAVINRDTQDPNIEHVLTDIYESYKINNPAHGQWTVKLVGTDVPAQGEDTTLVVSIKPEPNDSPTADAGDDQTVILPAGSAAMITLNGSNSIDSDDGIARFEWYKNSAKLGEGENLEISLPLGQHQIRLIVIDQAGAMDNDIVNVSISMSGDFDLDNDVDGSDLSIFAVDFGRTDCDDPYAEPCEGDFDNDGDVDGSDLAVFSSNFGRTN